MDMRDGTVTKRHGVGVYAGLRVYAVHCRAVSRFSREKPGRLRHNRIVHLKVNVPAIFWVAVTLLAVVMAAAPQPPAARQRIDVSKLGPQVGERVPDFNLKDQSGKSVNLRSLMGPNGAMLVFFRSADW